VRCGKGGSRLPAQGAAKAEPRQGWRWNNLARRVVVG